MTTRTQTAPVLDTGALSAPPTPPLAPALTPASWAVAASLLRTWLMTGVGYMIPFVVTGGLLISAGYLLGGPEVTTDVGGRAFQDAMAALADPGALMDRAGYAGLLYALGAATMFLLVPVLAGAIGFAMAGPLALVAGVVGGLLATATGAGYLGGLLAGLLAGGVVLALRRLPVPASVAGLFSVVVVPVLSTLAVGVAALGVIGPPAATFQERTTDALTSLSAAHPGLLGLVLGLMVAVDIGGPINKTAYLFALTMLGSGDGHAMAAVMAAGMTAPLAMALSTAVRPQLFPEPLHAAGRAGWLLGASFITEAAIPFAAADPLRVIPSIMAGGAVAGALSMTAQATSLAPHGGIWTLGLVGAPVAYVGAVLAGVLVTSGCVVAAKRIGRSPAHGSAPQT